MQVLVLLLLSVCCVLGQVKLLQNKGTGDKCDTSEFQGTCKLVTECPKILDNIRNRIFNHTVCGYQSLNQIICCPPQMSISVEERLSEYIFSEGFDCVVNSSNVKGVIKIKDDCPELESATDTHFLCTDEICRDLVCCPITNWYRHTQICLSVDNPQEEIALRLHGNQPCTVRDLNISGIYQNQCDYSVRNNNLKSFLTNICKDDICNHWYCCPIEDLDNVYCDRRPEQFAHIEFKGPTCVDLITGRPGTCRLPQNCPYHNVNHLEKCGQNCCEYYYCCPDEMFTAANELLVIQKCLEYTKYRFKKQIDVKMSPIDAKTQLQTKCIRVAGISGGYEVTPGEYPHMAALGYQRDNESIEFSCGGSLISERYVLTAGHCLKSSESGDVKIVRLGVVHLRTNKSNTFDCAEDYFVSYIIPHPEYTKRSVYNDIGLIHLDRDVKFNYYIRPICLPSSPEIPDTFQSMGWGAQGANDPQSLSLIQVKQELFTFEECTGIYQHFVNNRFREGVQNDTQICAGSRTGIQSTCGGDSGGPLLYYNHQIQLNKVYTVYGIVSFGTVCGFANSPGIYTKVYPYVEWIQNIVWN